MSVQHYLQRTIRVIRGLVYVDYIQISVQYIYVSLHTVQVYNYCTLYITVVLGQYSFERAEMEMQFNVIILILI